MFYQLQRKIDCQERKAEWNSKEVAELKEMLQKKDAEISKLNQKIAFQEKKLQEQEKSLQEKTLLLNSLTTLVEQLYRAQDEQQQDKIKTRLCTLSADYHTKHAEELRSMVYVYYFSYNIIHTLIITQYGSTVYIGMTAL